MRGCRLRPHRWCVDVDRRRRHQRRVHRVAVCVVNVLDVRDNHGAGRSVAPNVYGGNRGHAAATYAGTVSHALVQTVGYGDIGARTNTERVYSIFAQLIGASAFGFIIGNISSILERMDARAAAFKRRMDTLKEYLRHRDFPVELARRIVRYYEYYHSRKSGFDEAVRCSGA